MAAWPATLRARLTLWFTLVLGAPLLLFAIGSYEIFASTLLDRTDGFVSDALDAFSRELSAERLMTASATAAAKKTASEVRFRELEVVILDTTGAVIARGGEADVESTHPDLDLDALARQVGRAPWEAQVITLSDARGGYRVHARPVTLSGTALRIVAAYPMHDVETVLARIRRAFFIGLPLLLVCAAAGGFFLARRSLSPVQAMAARASAISASTLHERLPVPHPGDELSELATVINDLLDRLERSFAQQQRFMADASHELRTPTAIIRTEADVTLSRDVRPEAEYRASVEVMRDAARRLTRIVDDLFLLARADAGHLVVRRTDVHLEDVVHDAVRGIRPLAEQRGVQVELRDVLEAPVHGDADLLGRLVLNLLDNAVKHAPAGSAVEASLSEDGPAWCVRVLDHGAGIPTEAQARIFERFFRVDAARARSEQSTSSGAGLGLAIARRIAEAHGGTLQLEASSPGHTAFRARLPKREV